MEAEQRQETCIPVARMIDSDIWSVKSSAASATMQLYRDDNEKLMFVTEGEGLRRLMKVRTRKTKIDSLAASNVTKKTPTSCRRCSP